MQLLQSALWISQDGTDAKDNHALIMKYRGVAMHPEVDMAIEDIVNESVVGGQSVTNRWRWIRFTSWNLQLDIAVNLLSHFKLPLGTNAARLPNAIHVTKLLQQQCPIHNKSGVFQPT